MAAVRTMQSDKTSDWREELATLLAVSAKELHVSPADPNFISWITRLFYSFAKKKGELSPEARERYEKALIEYQNPRALSNLAVLVKANWPTETLNVNNHSDDGFKAKSAQAESQTRGGDAQARTAGKEIVFSFSGSSYEKLRFTEPFQNVLSVTTRGVFDSEGVRKSLEDCLRAKLQLDTLSLVACRIVAPDEIDLLVEHRGYVTKFCEVLQEVDWIASAWVKPVSEFGLPICCG